MLRISSQNRSAIGPLRILLAASVILPLTLFAVASWLDSRATFANAERDLTRESEVAREQAARVFNSQVLVADRVNDLIAGLGDAAIRQNEHDLHDELLRIIADRPEVHGVLVVDTSGHPLVGTAVMPIDHRRDESQHEFFAALHDQHKTVAFTAPQSGQLSHTKFFGVARPWTDRAGQVRGYIDIAILPSFFTDFYAMLTREGSDNPRGNVATLLRDDGQILARFPPLAGTSSRLPPGSPFFAAMGAHPETGTFESRSAFDPGAPSRVYAYRKVEEFPLYVVVGRSRASILSEWRKAMAGRLIFGLPATLALFAVAWTALRRAAREEAALSRVREEMQKREATEQALRQAQRLEAVGQLTGGVAHDFNNLLTVIMGSLETIGRRADKPDIVRKLASSALTAAGRGAEMTHKLLAFSRRQVVRPEVIDINARLQDFKPLLDHGATATVKLDLDLAEGVGAVRLDSGQFEAAILNLVVNARDAMPDGGHVVISTRPVWLTGTEGGDLPAGRYVCIAVSDSGTGMDPATIAKAFEPFFTTKEIGKGTGLGLSQVYGFAKQSGGDITLDSKPGQGTTVRIMLPRSDEMPTADPAQTVAAPQVLGTRREVVLVVEDEPTVLDIAVERLNELGYETLTAPDAAVALNHLRAGRRIDLLFSDVLMPGGMNGLQLLSEARHLRPDLKALLTSGYIAENVSDGLPPDVPLLPKPYSRDQLAARLQALLG